MITPALRTAAHAIAAPWIKTKESLRLHAYPDGAKVPTIGWGHTGSDVWLGRTITLAVAQQLFDSDLDAVFDQIAPLLTREPGAHQLAAMASLAFNIGIPRFATSSVLRRFNAGDDAGAGRAFALWRKITDPDTGKLVDSNGLITRRAEEALLYATPDNAERPAQVVVADMPGAPPDIPSTMPQAVEAAAPAGKSERIATAIIAAGGLGSAGTVVEKAADKGWPELLVLLGFIALLAVLGFLWWRNRTRRG